MKEIIDLKNFNGFPVVGGIQVKTMEFIPGSIKESVKVSKTILTNVIVNNYCNVNPKEAMEKNGTKYFTDTISCWMGELEIDFVVSIRNSHMIIERVEVSI